MGFAYNRQTNLLEQTDNNQNETIAVNSGRLATFLRASSENAHTFKRIYKFFSNQAHNSRLNAIGPNKLNYYNELYGKRYGQEWAEMSKLNIEYLMMVGRYNEWHPKFER